MAKILYEVKKDTNTASRTFGMWFGYVKSLETLNTRKLALHIRFLPEQATEENISSREFIKQAEFVLIDSLLPKEEEQSGPVEP